MFREGKFKMSFEEKYVFLSGPLAYDKSDEEKKLLIQQKQIEQVSFII